MATTNETWPFRDIELFEHQGELLQKLKFKSQKDDVHYSLLIKAYSLNLKEITANFIKHWGIGKWKVLVRLLMIGYMRKAV